MKSYDDVMAIQRRFKLRVRPKPTLLPQDEFRFRLNFLKEELEEFEEAHVLRDLEGASDGLIDLVVVAIGTAIGMGLPWEKLWNEVQRANMDKQPGATARFGTDLVKPDGWIPPQLGPILEAASLYCPTAPENPDRPCDSCSGDGSPEEGLLGECVATHCQDRGAHPAHCFHLTCNGGPCQKRRMQ